MAARLVSVGALACLGISSDNIGTESNVLLQSTKMFSIGPAGNSNGQDELPAQEDPPETMSTFVNSSVNGDGDEQVAMLLAETARCDAIVVNEPTNTVSRNGKVYATLDNAKPDSVHGEYPFINKNTWISRWACMPAGWDIAPRNHDSEQVAMGHVWQTMMMIISQCDYNTASTFNGRHPQWLGFCLGRVGSTSRSCCPTGKAYRITNNQNNRILISKVQPTCTCSGGSPATGSACTGSGGNQCASCSTGYFQVGNQCQKVTCQCDHGTAATGSACTEDGAHLCASCESDDYAGDQCKPVPIPYQEGSGKKNECPPNTDFVMSQDRCRKIAEHNNLQYGGVRPEEPENGHQRPKGCWTNTRATPHIIYFNEDVHGGAVKTNRYRPPVCEPVQ